ncbi:MAG: DUF4276 family protein [Acidobacteria bacterium]|nr:DUF4276 family protein [Acidobacteriota bacterium]
MTRLLVLVEGPTEENFVNRLLSPHLGRHGVWASARLMGRARPRARRGGIVGWPQARREIAHHLKEDRERCVTTMVDYYGLPQEGTTAWPSRAQAATARVVSERPVVVETAMHRDVSRDMGSGFLASRFVPFVMFHEFEALLFSDCSAFAAAIGRPALATDFQKIRDQLSSPEEINDSKNTAPSKRVSALVRGYSKPRMGQLAANAIGLDAMLLQCACFEDWLGQLERLPGGGASRQGNP